MTRVVVFLGIALLTLLAMAGSWLPALMVWLGWTTHQIDTLLPSLPSDMLAFFMTMAVLGFFAVIFGGMRARVKSDRAPGKSQRWWRQANMAVERWLGRTWYWSDREVWVEKRYSAPVEIVLHHAETSPRLTWRVLRDAITVTRIVEHSKPTTAQGRLLEDGVLEMSEEGFALEALRRPGVEQANLLQVRSVQVRQSITFSLTGGSLDSTQAVPRELDAPAVVLDPADEPEMLQALIQIAHAQGVESTLSDKVSVKQHSSMFA